MSVALLALAACTQQPTEKVKILAHRGNASTGAEFTTDENTLDALKRAQERDFDGIEFDVHLTADDQLVIHHDNKIPGTDLTCQGSTFDEIRAHRLPFGHQIPTLREWLEQAKQTPHILQMLELKSHKREREVLLITKCLEVIRELDMVDQMYMLSFKSETLDEVLPNSVASAFISLLFIVVYFRWLNQTGRCSSPSRRWGRSCPAVCLWSGGAGRSCAR